LGILSQIGNGLSQEAQEVLLDGEKKLDFENLMQLSLLMTF
jgi:hypothetical protein